jgi:hypothetical protein
MNYIEYVASILTVRNDAGLLCLFSHIRAVCNLCIESPTVCMKP